MHARIAFFAVIVRDYDEAIAWFVDKLGFVLLEDTDLGNGKRWVRVSPVPAHAGSAVLLARAVGPVQGASVGNQTGGRVFIFLQTDDFARDYALFRARGVQFERPPSVEPYGTVAVFRDVCGNLWDLVQWSDAGAARA